MLCVIDARVWLRFRPRACMLDEDGLEVVWPLKRRHIRHDPIRETCLTDRRALRPDLGWV
ncbi:MAG: hypothetical protein EOM91_07840 [Sphingobacteriia bacterium]|nr:hypothetical protein [Sphingobacteriia bacterium]NCC40982.1 hypothetical protein [Gammaproteobacteria bacterium]